MSALLELLREHKIAVAPASHAHHRPGWINLDCPRCTPGALHFRYGIPIGGYIGNCWACGKSPVVEVLHRLTGLGYHQLKQLLGDDRPAPIRVKPKGQLIMPPDLGKLAPAHIRYLTERRSFRLDQIDQLVSLWELRGISISHRLPWHIVIPIIHEGRTVSWTARTIGDSHQRYHSAKETEEEIPHKDLLFGEDYCRQTILVCEGPFDAMKIGPGAVATFGTAISPAQLERISHYPQRIICFDNETSAQKTARHLCSKLGSCWGRTINIVLDSKDPASASLQELGELRRLLTPE